MPLPQLFTYSVPPEFSGMASPGKRVIVQFGQKKLYSAIVSGFVDSAPANYQVKDILDVLDDEPVVNSFQLDFWKWIAGYYMCTEGEVYKAAIPSGLKLESETRVVYNEEFVETEKLSKNEMAVLDLLGQKNILTVSDIGKVISGKSPISVINSLLSKNALYLEENLAESYKPKTVTYIRLANSYSLDHEKLHVVFDDLARAKKQLEGFMKFIQISEVLNKKIPNIISKKQLVEESGVSAAVIKSLVVKGFLEEYEKTVDRLPGETVNVNELKELSEHQEKAISEIRTGFQDKQVCLLHGVTSSGKTELYIHLIKEYIEQGKQVLYLLPEIALTAQIINRLKSVFGNDVGVYHSKFSDAERVEIYRDILHQKKYKIILGVRSSVFLPFSNLGLIIVDEEHENSFKQYDPAPRYNARDAAVVLAQLHNSKVLLGTATPSVESYFNAINNKYFLVSLDRRHLEIKLPEIIIVNTKYERKRRKMHSHFSETLLNHIGEALENKEQVILFQNRRGFSPFVECSVCGWVPKCNHCDVSLTYHKGINSLVCHYCGYSVPLIGKCGACGSLSIETKGFGTEKIEDEIKIFFPEARIARMDTDSTRAKKSFDKIIGEFEQRNIDILVGTQMVTKGLDFDHVSLVGILNADNLLNFPDFRAFERSFQLMAQVSGRAGRKHRQGKVIIQTANPEHAIIKQVIENDYKGMYKDQLLDRRNFRYPPFYRLIKITLKHKNKQTLDAGAVQFGKLLRSVFGSRILGPEDPVINRIQNWYLKTILIKIEREKAGLKAKELIFQKIEILRLQPGYKSMIVSIDVDPM